MTAAVETGIINIDRGLPWHREGNFVHGVMTAEEVLTGGGLNWSVDLYPMFVPFGLTTVEVPEQFAVVRETDGSILGVVGDRYQPIQNAEALSFLDSIVGNGEAVYDSGWSLRGGKTVAVTAELSNVLKPADGEEIKGYITISTTHDGSGKLRIMVTPIRVVCMNTLMMATRDAQFVWERKHTMNALTAQSVADARETLHMAYDSMAWVEKEAKRMLNEAFSKAQFESMAETLILGATEDIIRAEERRISTQKQNQFEQLMAVYTNTDNLQNIRDTKWGALQAVAEYADYYGRYRGDNKEDNRTESILTGSAMQLKSKAHDILLAA